MTDDVATQAFSYGLAFSVKAVGFSGRGAGSAQRGLVVAGGVDVVAGADFACGRVRDGHVAVVDQQQHGQADVAASDSEVAHLTGVALGDLPILVDLVGEGAQFPV